MAPPREADPRAELPIKNFKYVKDCTELYLSNRGIDVIAGFDDFVNLESLWLNDNNIEALVGLEPCFRLKQLYVQNNRIRSLEESSLPCFKFLQELRLYDNKLRDLPAALAVLSRLRHLEDLDLFGNALDQEDNYRLHVIRTLPSLLVLDRHVITDDERARAARLPAFRDERLTSSTAVSVTLTQSKPKPKRAVVVAGAPPQIMSGTVKMLFREVRAIEREQKELAAAAHAAELEATAAAHRMLAAPTNKGIHGMTDATTDAAWGLLDAWEKAALRTHFRELEAPKNVGITQEQFQSVVEHLGDRGFQVCTPSSDGDVGQKGDASVLVKAAFPTLDDRALITWKLLEQSFNDHSLRCELLSASALQTRADELFARSSSTQRRLLSGSSNDNQSTLAKDVHNWSQRAYHLQTLAQQQTRRTAKPKRRASLSGEHTVTTVMEKTATESVLVPPSKTRYYVTAYSRADDLSTQFHELKAQSADVGNEVAVKYKLHNKDFNKYLLKKAPPQARLVRRQFNM